MSAWTKHPVRDLHLSLKGAKSIARFEGFVDHLYNLFHVAHIGIGHRLHDGDYTAEDVRKWGGPPAGHITFDEALALLRKDAREVEDALRAKLRVPLRQGQWDALVSLGFNLGPYGFDDVIALINAGDDRAARKAILKYDHANGEQLAGLTKRRQIEALIFRSPGFYYLNR